MAEDKEPTENPKDDLLSEAKERFQTAISFWGEEYDRAEFDTKFAYGINQWPQAVRARREKDGRPCLTENQLLPFIHQTLNDIRQTRPAINVMPVDDKADKETARVLKGMIRNIENQSGADNVYDTAAQNAIQGGYGFMRVDKIYADNDSFKQELRFRRIINFQSVVFDHNSVEMDGSDAEFAFIYDKLTHDQFKREYPKASPVSWDNFRDNQWAWSTDEYVLVAEYFYKVYNDVELALLPDRSTVKASEVPEGIEPVAKRVARVPSIKWCKFSGQEVLEETDWDGIYIPIVPVYGEETFWDGKRRVYSLIHQAIDPQMRLNYWISANTEIIALQPKAPYIGAKGSFKTHAAKWANANNESYAFLEYDVVTLQNGSLAPAPQRAQPPQASIGMFQETIAAIQGVKNTLGIFDANLGKAGNETSGKAIIARQQEGDNATFHFVDNLSTSIRHMGRIAVDLIPRVYTGAQMARIIGDDDQEKVVPINQGVIKAGKELMPIGSQAQGQLLQIDLSVGKYDVVCTVGPSYATKRQETNATLLEVMKQVPGAAPLIGDLVAKNLDIAEADIIAERLQSLLPPEMRGDGQDPAQKQLQAAAMQMQEMQTVIMQMEQALKQKQDNQQAENDYKRGELELKAKQLEIDAAKTAAEIAKIQAETAGLVPPEAMNAVLSTIDELNGRMQDVAEAVNIILDAEEAKQVPPMPPMAEGQIPQQMGQ